MGKHLLNPEKEDEMELEKYAELKRLEKKEKAITRTLNDCKGQDQFRWKYENILKEIDRDGEYEFLKIAFKCARKVAAQRGWKFI